MTTPEEEVLDVIAYWLGDWHWNFANNVTDDYVTPSEMLVADLAAAGFRIVADGGDATSDEISDEISDKPVHRHVLQYVPLDDGAVSHIYGPPCIRCGETSDA